MTDQGQNRKPRIRNRPSAQRGFRLFARCDGSARYYRQVTKRRDRRYADKYCTGGYYGICDRQKIETGGTDVMRSLILIEALAFALIAALCATVGPANAQAPARPTNAGPVQPWG